MTTEPSVPPTGPTENRGSLLLGFLLGWAILIIAHVIALGVAAVIGTYGYFIRGGSAFIPVLLALPWIGLLGLIVFFAIRNQSRSAIGVLLAVASLFALALLLVAACFGLFALGGRWN